MGDLPDDNIDVTKGRVFADLIAGRSENAVRRMMNGNAELGLSIPVSLCDHILGGGRAGQARGRKNLQKFLRCEESCWKHRVGLRQTNLTSPVSLYLSAEDCCSSAPLPVR